MDYRQQRLAHDGVRAWLEQRGIPPDTEYPLGYVGDPILDEDRRYLGYLSIPYVDAQKRIRAVRYRRIADADGQKYLAPHGSRRHLFNVQATQAPYPVICEGELDALLLIERYNIAAVGIPGAQSWAKGWRYLFRDAEFVLVATDGDEEGREASRRIAASLAPLVPVEEAQIPAGHDITSLWQQRPEELGEILGL